MDCTLDINGVTWPLISLTWESHRVGKPAMIYADLPIAVDVMPEVGQVAVARYGEKVLFHGFIFESSVLSDRFRIIAYDQIRYLMFKDSYIFENTSADKIIAMIANDMGLSVGTLDGTNYPIDLVIEDKKLIDIIDQSLQMTFEQTGQRFTLWDDDAKLYLSARDSLDSKILIDPDSLMTGFVKSESIDRDSYNRIKLAQKNKKQGLRTIAVEFDGDSAKDWGILQLYERVDEKLTETQIRNQALKLLQEKNRPTQSLSINAIGHPDLRSGFIVSVQLPDDKSIGQYVVEHATHRWNGAKYLMSLELEAL